MVGLFWGHSGQDLTLTAVVKMACFGSGHYDVQTNAFKQILNIHRLLRGGTVGFHCVY